MSITQAFHQDFKNGDRAVAVVGYAMFCYGYRQGGMSLDPRGRSIIFVDPTIKLHEGFRIPLNPVAKSIAGSVTVPNTTAKAWTGSVISYDLVTKSLRSPIP